MKAGTVIVGAGPAGLAAAETAGGALLLDDNPAPGGQIWRGSKVAIPEGAQVMCGTRVIAASGRQLVAETPDAVIRIEFQKLILATGARELFLPFPGWTLPTVMGAGGLQAMVKGGLPIEGKRVIVAGSGPLLLAVAAYLRSRGGKIVLIAEQSEQARRFARTLAAYPGKLAQAAGLKLRLTGIRYLEGCWVLSADPHAVTLTQSGRAWTESCDYLAVGYGLQPNTELAQLLGCQIENGFVKVDEFQQTTVTGIYCAGEPAGIGGVDLAVIEGRIAGCAHANDARRFFAKRARQQRFAAALETAFVLRREVTQLAGDDTVICRCEDVPLGRIRQHANWREAKLQTRCGMGPCQGRICGPALQHILGWKNDSVREPLFPARVASLME
ncbi:MAG: FAD/NAD(P)-binding oxidoreductase [Bryobacteraceae bacterium]|nr:FAD/NAD(P)-binding oxidoreductase [Bryobacteraceae bacterium]